VQAYEAVSRALRRDAAAALAAKVSVAVQWLQRNHAEVDRLLKTVESKLDDGALSQQLRTLPSLRADVAARLEQRLGISEAGAGGFSDLLARAARRSHLAWSKYERDWVVDETTALRIPEGFVVSETKGRISVHWSTPLQQQQPHGWGHAGRLAISNGVVLRRRWLRGEQPLPLHSVRTEERHQREGHVRYSVVGTEPTGVVDRLFAVATLQAAEFLCDVICHFTDTRRDTHSVRAFVLD